MLHDYLLKKQELLNTVDPDLCLYTEKDVAELMCWWNSRKRHVTKELLYVLQVHPHPADWLLCPWCILYFDTKCNECKYGERHGICSEDGSDYKKVTERLPSIVNRLQQVPDYRQQLLDSLLLNVKQLYASGFPCEVCTVTPPEITFPPLSQKIKGDC